MTWKRLWSGIRVHTPNLLLILNMCGYELTLGFVARLVVGSIPTSSQPQFEVPLSKTLNLKLLPMAGRSC